MKIINLLKSVISKTTNIVNNFMDSKEEIFFIKCSFLLVGFVFFPTFISSILYLFKISISYFHLPISLILLFFVYYKLYYDKNNKKDFYTPIIISSILIIISIILSILLFENSWDGWAYHLPAVIHLKEGWNPIYTHDESIGIWSLHYPKFIWIYGANIYKLTNCMASGTSFNTIICLSMLFFSIHMFKKLKFKNIQNILFSFIIAFNFISLRQLFSYYNDGVLGLCILALLFIFHLVSNKKEQIDKNYTLLLLLAFYSSILANIKFNGSLFALLIIGFFTIYCLIKKKLKWNKFLISFVAIIGISVLSVACTTYLPNYINHKNIGYPIMGEGKIDIITGFVPEYMKNDGKIISFIKSFTSDSTLDNYKFKPFFNISINDFKNAVSTDSSNNGFGPFYQLIVILFIGLLIYSLISYLKDKKLNSQKLKEIILNKQNELYILGILVILFFATPATWWARYIPYMYTLPLIIIIFFKSNFERKKISKIITYLIISVYIFNILLFGAGRIYSQVQFTNNLNSQIKELKELANNEELHISVYDESAEYYKEFVRNELFKKNNIKFIEHKENECSKIKQYYTLSIDTVNCDK